MRYHFHEHDGEEHRDETGEELPNLEAATVVAAKLLGQTIADEPVELFRDGERTVRCTDAHDMTLFELSTIVTKAPSIG